MRKKRIISLFLSLVLAVSMLFTVNLDVKAVSQNDVVSQLNAYISQYNGRTANANQMYMGSQCKGFANWIFLKIFGVYIGPYPESANYKITNPNAQTVGILEPGNLNAATAKALLQKGLPGDYIQVQRSTARGRGPHSMILVGVNDNGIEVFDCNSDGRNTIKKYGISWSAFDTANRAMSLYHAHNYTASPAMPSNPQPSFGNLVNLGDSFSARIRHSSSGKLLTNWDNSNVYLDSAKSEYFAKQIWKFKRNGDGSYKITSPVTDVSMDVDCARDEDTTNIKLHPSYDTAAQNWFIYQRDDGTLLFRAAVSQTRVFDIEYGSTDDGTNLWLYTSHGSDAQKFYVDKCANVGNFGDSFDAMILNKDCWKPIMVGEANRVFLSTETVENQPRQLWHFTYNPNDGSYFIQSYYNQHYLDVAGGGDCDGTPIGVWHENKEAPQRWFISDIGDGYELKSACATRVMDVLLGSEDDGTPIQLWTMNGSPAQKFQIYKLDGERDKISYNLYSDSASIGVGEKAKITVGDAWYGVDYKLHIVSPDGKTSTVSLGTQNTYDFSADKKGVYKIYASVKSPVSSYSGSVNERCIEIAVGYGYQASDERSVVFNGHLYQLVEKEHVNWAQAKGYCEGKNSYLAAITSEEENRQVAKLVGNYGGEAYIGGVRKDAKNFRWVAASGEEFTYSNWSAGEPNYHNHGTCQIRDPYGEYARENYIGMYTDGTWNDYMVLSQSVNAFVMESEVTSLQVGAPAKTVYKVGDRFDKGSIVVKAVFSDGSKREVTDYAISGFDSGKEGAQKVTVSYFGVSQPIDVIVEAAAVEKEHDYALSGTKMAGCTEEGYRKYTCRNCNDSYTEPIPATGHSWDAGEVTVEATATTEGTLTYTCASCKGTKTEPIPATGQTGGSHPDDKDDPDNKDNPDDKDSPDKDKTDVEEKDPDKDKTDVDEGKGPNGGNSPDKDDKEPGNEEEPDTDGEEDLNTLDVGDVVEDAKSGDEYEVISMDGNAICVEYVESANPKASTIKIPATIKTEDGAVCKVTSISKCAFRNNRRLKKAVIGGNVTAIGTKAFSGCKNLTSVTIGKNVVAIGANAFSNCVKLTSLTIPAKVAKIGSNAFSGCRKLKKLSIKSSKLDKKGLHKKAFKGLPVKTVIQVPKAKLKVYKKLFTQRGLGKKNKIR